MNKLFRLTLTASTSRALAALGLCALVVLLTACGDRSNGKSDASTTPAPIANASEGQRIIGQYLALDNSRDLSMKLQVKMQDSDGQSREVLLNIAKKREADGRRLFFSEFLSPAEERDRNALITISPQGDIEGTRYIQSNDSFATVKGATNEDSFFGLTIQEMVDGQPEKYDFKLASEENIGATPAYKLEGTLKKGADSRFPRVVMWLAKDNYTALVAEFYDNKNELNRRVNITKSEQINGHWLRTQYTIENPLRKKRLEFEVKEAKFDQNLSAALFSREHLKKVTFK
ncbi:MAG: outer membrane lipoprotein-sorting protein [Acidobacteria bacterium]|nr:outer membrane lipoprotein-sorting protein [Acidobacteriota bacterium]